jgi:hypothetical protein
MTMAVIGGLRERSAVRNTRALWQCTSIDRGLPR